MKPFITIAIAVTIGLLVPPFVFNYLDTPVKNAKITIEGNIMDGCVGVIIDVMPIEGEYVLNRVSCPGDIELDKDMEFRVPTTNIIRGNYGR